jgi:hypothetical protein
VQPQCGDVRARVSDLMRGLPMVCLPEPAPHRPQRRRQELHFPYETFPPSPPCSFPCALTQIALRFTRTGCLGGLWKIPQGSITRPGGATGSSGLNQTVFYIPQKPYNVIGTLQDQMTYPDTSGAEALTKERLLEILAEVNLEHLVER